MPNEIEVAFQSGFQKEAQKKTTRDRAGRIGTGVGAGVFGALGAGGGTLLGATPTGVADLFGEFGGQLIEESDASKIKKLLFRGGDKAASGLSRLGPYGGALAGLAGGAALGGAALGGGSYLAGAGVDALQK